MTPFLLLTFAIGGLATAWLTHPLWQRGAAPANTGAAPVAPAHRSLGLSAALAVFVIGVAGLGYAWLGAPGQLDVGPTGGSAPAAAAATDRTVRSDSSAPVGPAGVPARNTATALPQPAPATDTLAQTEARVAAMVERLAERQKSRPGDAEGWQMLGRSYAALGQHAKAVDAFRTALRLRPDDATLLAESAYSAAVIDPQGANGEPARWIARALRLEPDNPKALALAGTLAVDRKDYAGAVRYWEHLARVEPPDSKVARQVQVSILQARQLAANERASTPTTALAQTPGAMVAARAQVSGMVTLAPALRARVAPDDTVFVYARPADGPRMPLAVLRKQVRDLPLRFTLDDSLAMSAGAKLSGASSVVVGARIARAGNALPRAGDLQGQLPAVAVGSADLKVEIDQIVGPR